MRIKMVGIQLSRSNNESSDHQPRLDRTRKESRLEKRPEEWHNRPPKCNNTAAQTSTSCLLSYPLLPLTSKSPHPSLSSPAKFREPSTIKKLGHRNLYSNCALTHLSFSMMTSSVLISILSNFTVLLSSLADIYHLSQQIFEVMIRG